MEDSAEGQRLRFLENEIHKTNLKLMEGETIKKKYMAILDMLKKERLTFGNQVGELDTDFSIQIITLRVLIIVPRSFWFFSAVAV